MMVAPQKQEPKHLVLQPHARTLRKAREVIMSMVKGGFSTPRIKLYALQWIRWWVGTLSGIWEKSELLQWLIDSCYEISRPVADYATGLLVLMARVTPLSCKKKLVLGHIVAFA